MTNYIVCIIPDQEMLGKNKFTNPYQTVNYRDRLQFKLKVNAKFRLICCQLVSSVQSVHQSSSSSLRFATPNSPTPLSESIFNSKLNISSPIENGGHKSTQLYTPKLVKLECRDNRPRVMEPRIWNPAF